MKLDTKSGQSIKQFVKQPSDDVKYITDLLLNKPKGIPSGCDRGIINRSCAIITLSSL